jgi:CRP-like cAMP-binding protein
MASLGKRWQDGEVICRRGDTEECMYAIQSGCVEALQEEGDKEVVVGELTAGDFFGEMALFDQQRHPMTMRAKGETRVLAIDRPAFIRRVQEDPSFAFRMLERLAQHIRTLVTEVSLLKRSDTSHPTTVNIRGRTLVELSMAGWALIPDDTRVSLGIEARHHSRFRARTLWIMLAAAAVGALGALGAILAFGRHWF